MANLMVPEPMDIDGPSYIEEQGQNQTQQPKLHQQQDQNIHSWCMDVDGPSYLGEDNNNNNNHNISITSEKTHSQTHSLKSLLQRTATATARQHPRRFNPPYLRAPSVSLYDQNWERPPVSVLNSGQTVYNSDYSYKPRSLLKQTQHLLPGRVNHPSYQTAPSEAHAKTLEQDPDSDSKKRKRFSPTGAAKSKLDFSTSSILLASTPATTAPPVFVPNHEVSSPYLPSLVARRMAPYKPFPGQKPKSITPADMERYKDWEFHSRKTDWRYPECPWYGDPDGEPSIDEDRDAPARRIGGMVLGIFTLSWSIAAGVWDWLRGNPIPQQAQGQAQRQEQGHAQGQVQGQVQGAPQEQVQRQVQEIIAVETNNRGNKRRAVDGSSPPSTPSNSRRSSMPGEWPQTPPPDEQHVQLAQQVNEQQMAVEEAWRLYNVQQASPPYGRQQQTSFQHLAQQQQPSPQHTPPQQAAQQQASPQSQTAQQQASSQSSSPRDARTNQNPPKSNVRSDAAKTNVADASIQSQSESASPKTREPTAGQMKLARSMAKRAGGFNKENMKPGKMSYQINRKTAIGCSTTKRPPRLPMRDMLNKQRRDKDAEVRMLCEKGKRVTLGTIAEQNFRESMRREKEAKHKADAAAAEAAAKYAEEQEEELRLAREAEEDRVYEEERLKEEENQAKAVAVAKEKEEKAKAKPEAEEKAKADAVALENSLGSTHLDGIDKGRLVRPLDKATSKRLAMALAVSATTPICTTAEGNELTRRDFGTLVATSSAVATTDDPTPWLNDDIVNGFLAAIIARKLEQTNYTKSATSVPAFAAYHSGWYTTYTKRGIAGIKNWSRRKGVSGTKLLKADRIFFPVNTGVHWMLLIISPTTRRIEFLDSLNGATSQKRFFAIAREWLAMELGDAYQAEEWTDEWKSKSSLQTNSDDCGVFTSLNALASAKDMSYGELNGHEMGDGRRIMAMVLLDGGFGGEWEL